MKNTTKKTISGTAVETKHKNSVMDYMFVLAIFIVAMFFPFEAFLIWLGVKGKELYERRHASSDKQTQTV